MAQTLAQTFTGRKRIRKFFGHIREVAEMPNLIEVQKASYDQFLLVDEPKGGRPDRKVHVLNSGSTTPEPVALKLGISDNLFTEVISGLAEGDVIVTAVKNTGAESPVKPAVNPLGGPQMRTR
jgi:hypothetical protein